MSRILSEAVVVEAVRAHDTHSAEALKPAEALCMDRPEAVIRSVRSSSMASTALRVCELCKIESRRGVSLPFDSAVTAVATVIWQVWSRPDLSYQTRS